MVQAKIEYKDGRVEFKTFPNSGEYCRFVDAKREAIRIVTADPIRPRQLKQGRCDRVVKDKYFLD